MYQKNLFIGRGNLKMKKIIKIGKDYPKPIVIHEKARERALKAFQMI